MGGVSSGDNGRGSSGNTVMYYGSSTAEAHKCCCMLENTQFCCNGQYIRVDIQLHMYDCIHIESTGVEYMCVCACF